MRSRVIYLTILTSLLSLSALRPLPSSAKTPSGFFWPAPDTIQTAQSADSLTSAHLQIDSLPKVKTAQDTTRLLLAVSDSLLKHTKPFKLKSDVPDPKRALWLALVLPGAGQIYNRKYWKLIGSSFDFCDSKDSPRGSSNSAVTESDSFKAAEDDIPF